MHNRGILILVFAFLILQGSVGAEVHTIKHVPPVFTLGKAMIAKINGDKIKRGRVLIADKDGIRVQKLEKEGDYYFANLDFLSLALLKYQFQVEFEDGFVTESEYYYIRQPSTDDLEEKIRALNDELSLVRTRIRQMENGIFSLSNTDSAVFQKKKSEELGNALIVLRKKEKEYNQVLKDAENVYVQWRESMNSDPRGKYVSVSRKDLEEDNQFFWKIQGQ